MPSWKTVRDGRLRVFCDGLENKDDAYAYLKGLNIKKSNMTTINGKIEGVHDLTLNASMPAIRSIYVHKELEDAWGITIPHAVYEEVFAITGNHEDVRHLIHWLDNCPMDKQDMINILWNGFAIILRLDAPTTSNGPVYTDAGLIRNQKGFYIVTSRRVLVQHISDE